MRLERTVDAVEVEVRGRGTTLEQPTPVEQALRASELRYRRLFEAAQDGILILDADTGRVIDVNPYLAELLDYPRADFLGKQIWDFGPFQDVVASKEAFAELQAMDYVAYEDLPLETSDGRRVDVGFVSNVYLVDGKRIIQCNIRDITKRKLAETTRLNLEMQLRATQKMEAIGGLAGGIAHDFNNLLSVILCYTGFALEALPESSPVRSDLLEVEKASTLAAGLTRQLLAFCRKQVLQPVPLDLNQAIEGIEQMLRRILGEDVELIHTLAPELGVILADPGQFEQVLMNLVVNARDAMPDGGTLTLETANADVQAGDATLPAVAPGAYVMLAITDTGCGMDPPTVARIFEPFFTTKAPGKGTGLGLSTVYGIVNQSGGSVGVQSQVGRGTRFEIYLPRQELTVAAGPRTPAHGTATRRRGTETILVVEDEHAVRVLAQRILSAAGYRVLTATDGRDALRLCEAHEGPLSLVLTDVVMPHLNGRSFAAGLRQRRPATKILFMSGYSDDAIAHHGRLEPGASFIGKPFTGPELTCKVRELLDQDVVDAVGAGER